MPATRTNATTVLVVDDSALYRQAICNILREEPDIEVVGIARNGLEALEKIHELAPDVLTLDVQMPDMDGIEVLREMNQRGMRAKAIMVSSHTSEGAQVTTDALLEGAFDFILKPSGGNLQENRRNLRDALAEKIGVFRGSRRARAMHLASGSRAAPQAAPTGTRAKTGRACRAVVIASSTGGPAALKQVLSKLPGNLAVPVLIVQHMPARYTAALAQRLDQMCALDIKEAREGMRLEPNLVLLAPGGQQMKFVSRAGSVFVRITDSPPENGCRPSADYMFRSAAKVFDSDVLGVVLTGMGRDGFLGCEALKSGGAVIYAQDEESATVYGMPKAVVEGGLADRVLPLEDMSRAIKHHVKGHRV